MGFFSGKTVLKYKKKTDSYENSTGSCRVLSGYALPYREKLAISKEFKIGKKKYNILFYNTHYWSRKSQSHLAAIKGHKALNPGIEISLNFDGSMDFLYHHDNSLTLDVFEVCSLNDNLIKFAMEYFPKKEALKFISNKRAQEELDIIAENTLAAGNRIAKKIRNLNYATPENLDRAIVKFKKLAGRQAAVGYIDSDELAKNGRKFIHVLEKHISLFSNDLIEKMVELKKLEIFTELDGMAV